MSLKVISIVIQQTHTGGYEITVGLDAYAGIMILFVLLVALFFKGTTPRRA